MLPTDPKARKALQLYTFMFGYFPDAWLAVVDVARAGNEQHNPGEPLHWAREKSTDQMNAAFNHQFDYGLGQMIDTDGCWHLAKSIWRLMAQLQLDIEENELNKAKDVATERAYLEIADQLKLDEKSASPEAAGATISTDPCPQYSVFRKEAGLLPDAIIGHGAQQYASLLAQCKAYSTYGRCMLTEGHPGAHEGPVHASHYEQAPAKVDG